MTGEEQLFREHPRTLGATRYVYAVVSRRSRGVSIGINLNPDGRCNFDCAYCQVDRRTPRPDDDVDEGVLARELDQVIAHVTSGALWEDERFRRTPIELRRLNDLAFSGDGEPTAHPRFAELVALVAERSRAHGLPELGVKLVLITNASLLGRDAVKRGLDVLFAHGGEVWAKLDAGTEALYQLVSRTHVPFARVLDNLSETAKRYPIVVQTNFSSLHGEGPSARELEAYAGRLRAILAAGGRITRVDLYTTARAPAEPWVAPLSREALEHIAAELRAATGLEVHTFA